MAGFLGQSAHVLRVDGTAQPVLNLRFRVQSYPSFFLVYRHAVYKFTAARSVDNLIHFVQDTDKKSLNYFGGPLSPYWTVVTATLRFVDMLRHQVALFQASGGDLTFLIIAVVIGVLSGLILAIYFITKPSILPPRRPIHPHAE